jgi:hypothetical protein
MARGVLGAALSLHLSQGADMSRPMRLLVLGVVFAAATAAQVSLPYYKPGCVAGLRGLFP